MNQPTEPGDVPAADQEAPAAEEAAGVAWAVQMPSPREEPRPRKRGRRKAGAREQPSAEQAAPAAEPTPGPQDAPAAERAPAGVAWAVRLPGAEEESVAEEARASTEEPALAEEEPVEQELATETTEEEPADGNGWAVRVKAAPQSVRPARRRSAPGRRRLTRVPLRALVAVVVVAVLLVGWLALRLRDDRAATVAREEAVAAARLHAPEILSYDYRHLDQDFAKAAGAPVRQPADHHRQDQGPAGRPQPCAHDPAADQAGLAGQQRGGAVGGLTGRDRWVQRAVMQTRRGRGPYEPVEGVVSRGGVTARRGAAPRRPAGGSR